MRAVNAVTEWAFRRPLLAGPLFAVLAVAVLVAFAASTAPRPPAVAEASATVEPGTGGVFGHVLDTYPTPVVDTPTPTPTPSVTPSPAGPLKVATAFLAAYSDTRLTTPRWRAALAPYATAGLRRRLALSRPQPIPGAGHLRIVVTATDANGARVEATRPGGQRAVLAMETLEGPWRVDSVTLDLGE